MQRMANPGEVELSVVTSEDPGEARSTNLFSSLRLTVLHFTSSIAALRWPSSETQSPKEFEANVHNVKWKACSVAFLHILSRFFGICALTWASAMLLGGFVSSLTTINFFLISAIIVVEAIRLFIIDTTSNLSSEGRKSFDYGTQTARLRLDLIFQATSFVISLVNLVVVVVWFFKWRDTAFDTTDASPAAAPTQDANRVNLPRALYIFYLLALLNSWTSLLSTVLRFIFRRACDAQGQNCLMCFHDEVFRRAIVFGLPDADRLEILEFAFAKLASDFRRNIRPQIIKRDNMDLIRYLYKNQQGIAMVCEVLNSSSDVWQKVVAANLPGFWVDQRRIHTHLPLFWALGARMHGAGKDSKGAMNSIEHLAWSFARKGSIIPHPFLEEDPTIEAGRYCIVRRLVRLISKRFYPTLLFQIRALHACCESLQVLDYLCASRSWPGGSSTGGNVTQDMTAEGVETSGGEDAEDLRTLCRALEGSLFIRGRGTEAAGIYAVSLLVKLLPGLPEGLTREMKEAFQRPVREFIQKKTAETTKSFVWSDREVQIVEELITALGMSEVPDWRDVEIRSTENGEVPSLISTGSPSTGSSDPCAVWRAGF